jgi:hypothetical protein
MTDLTATLAAMKACRDAMIHAINREIPTPFKGSSGVGKYNGGFRAKRHFRLPDGPLGLRNSGERQSEHGLVSPALA